MDKKKFIQITSGEIASITHEMFFDYTDEIIRKSNPLHGERSFVLCILYSGSVVKTKIQAFYNEPISVAELGRCPR